MGSIRYDVVGIGNAIIDAVTFVDESFLKTHKLEKGCTGLVDFPRAENLRLKCNSWELCSGGSLANTMAALASFGAKSLYVGKVRNDEFGQIFERDLRKIGVDFKTPINESGPATARCLVFVTPDAVRTMQTYLGACTTLTPDDINFDDIVAGNILYLEGYLWDAPLAQKTLATAATIAKDATRVVAFSLSDRLCAQRHQKDFLNFIKGPVDIVFANRQEALALVDSESLDDVVAFFKQHKKTAFITLGQKGSMAISPEGVVEIAPAKVDKLIDTTGAGDLYASGILFGISQGMNVNDAGRLASCAAAEILSYTGARVKSPLTMVCKSILDSSKTMLG